MFPTRWFYRLFVALLTAVIVAVTTTCVIYDTETEYFQLVICNYLQFAIDVKSYKIEIIILICFSTRFRAFEFACMYICLLVC